MPAVVALDLSVGGLLYTCIPFNGWYSVTEIVRNLTDEARYNQCLPVAKKLGFDTKSNVTMWRDKVTRMSRGMGDRGASRHGWGWGVCVFVCQCLWVCVCGGGARMHAHAPRHTVGLNGSHRCAPPPPNMPLPPPVMPAGYRRGGGGRHQQLP